MNIRNELQTMSITDLKSVCRELGVSCPNSKEDVIKRLLDPLKRGYKMNMDSESENLIHNIDIGYLEKIQDLIDNGLDINKPYNDKLPLVVAVVLNKVDIVRLLIDKGADVNIRSDDNLTPIMYTDNKKIAELLIDNGADVNARDDEGQTALMQTENLKVAQLLIDNGANINEIDNEHQTAIFINVRNDKTQMVRLLIDNGADIHIRDENDETILSYAENPDIAQLLIDNGADVNETNRSGKTALYFNSKYANIDMVNLLLSNGATISVEYIDGNIKIPVFIVIKKHIRDIESLLKIKLSRKPKKRRKQIQSNKEFKQKMIVLKEIEKILKNHYLNLLLDQFKKSYEIKELELILLRIKNFVKEYGSVNTFRNKFILLIKSRKDSLKLSDKYNWNRKIAGLVGEILRLSK